MERFKRSAAFSIRRVGNETLLVPLGSQLADTNGLILLNETAHCIWELLDEDRAFDELVWAIQEKFEVSHGQASRDVRTFLNEIQEIGMLER
jgi:hypothetical protein